ncbi:hypothetical protein [Fimbriiglobus ruber]|uniref:Uncharacterized protein n=1 Tax=Fimbriiglobus ruber TaxID=1908690 RepID=A0A225DL14_9BACT|nr:hypothetical protein [Fimbriiglobus ruber]OWK37859.1 hypothetical protein FRUB_06979 [Fimbriiglobus ruber]
MNYWNYGKWLAKQPVDAKNAWLTDLLADPRSTVRRDILAEFQKTTTVPSWPTANLGRTLAELETAAELVQKDSQAKAATKAAAERSKRLAALAADPLPTMQETERLASQRSLKAYVKIAELLADLREALAGTPSAGRAEQQALKLRSANPTLRGLISELRKKGLLPK